jgi:hypothetical protein
MFLKWTDNAWWCARSLSLHRAHFATHSSAYCYNEWMVADGYIFLRVRTKFNVDMSRKYGTERNAVH